MNSNIVKSAVDYDKEIVNTFERINRLLPIRTATDSQLVELATLYQHLNAVKEAKKANIKWTITNFDELVSNSKSGRERLAVYPYPDNKFDNIAKHNKLMLRIKSNKARKILKMRIAQSLVLSQYP